jgi:predicted dehydrogenase
VAVADVDIARAQSAAEKFKVPQAYGSEMALLNDENVEAVALALPTGVRGPVAHAALVAGKHVLLEKPIASNAEQVEQLIGQRSDRTVACCSSRFAFTDSAEAAADCVRSGKLGRIRTVHCRVLVGAKEKPEDPPPPWRESFMLNGGGILVNWGCYDLDYLMYLTGWELKPRLVLAKWWPAAERLSARVAPGSDADAHYTATMHCESGVVFHFERAEFSAHAGCQAWQIIGTEGSLELNMLPGREKTIRLDRADADKGVVSETLWEGTDQRAMNRRMMDDFARAIRGEARPRTDLERALRMQQITDAIYRSARSGLAVEMSQQ